VAAASASYLWVNARMYPSNERTDITVAALGRGSFADYAAVAIGQTWYHTFAWAGLALLGTFWLVRRAWRGPHRVFARWALASLGAEAIFVVGVLSGALTWSLRVDLHIYGRYYGS